LVSYRLAYVAEAAGVEFDESAWHDPEYDAYMAAMILLDIAGRCEATSFEELEAKTHVRLGRISADSWNGSSGPQRTASEIEVNTNADPQGALFGLGVTFTGALSSMPRQAAWEKVAEAGGMPLESVTSKTNLLVFGFQDSRFLTPGSTHSAKFEKALALKAKGVAIEVIGEDEWLKMLDETSSGGSRIVNV
jgi:DNA polymerase-3 subunit epsilon